MCLCASGFAAFQQWIKLGWSMLPNVAKCFGRHLNMEMALQGENKSAYLLSLLPQCSGTEREVGPHK